MPNTRQATAFYSTRQGPGTQGEKPERLPARELSALEAEITAADNATAQGKIYNPYPNAKPITDNRGNSDTAVKAGLDLYLNSNNSEELEKAKQQLLSAKKSGLSGYYNQRQVDSALATIDREIAGYKARGL